MNGLDPAKDHRISLGCLSDGALERYLKQHPEIKRIVFALDNDVDGRSAVFAEGKHTVHPHNHGQEAAKKFCDKYGQQDYTVSIQIPKSKDFNEDLLQIRNAQTAVQTVETEQEDEDELAM